MILEHFDGWAAYDREKEEGGKLDRARTSRKLDLSDNEAGLILAGLTVLAVLSRGQGDPWGDGEAAQLLHDRLARDLG